ncbi:MAG TPA: IS630 family transposase [Gemmataceae bacterium]|nr:IS630 family transposase [Gemmataceae bacterium]
MREFTFSDEDLKAIDHDRYHHPHPHVQRKMEVLWLKSHGLPHQRIAGLAGVCRRTVQRYLDEYKESGLKQVRRCKWRGPKSAPLRHERSVEEYFWGHPPRSTKQAAQVIFEQTGLRRGLTQVRAFLKTHLGLRYRNVSAIPVPPKKTIEEHAEEQARFLDQELEPALAEARAGRSAVYFVDAAHFVWAPFLGCLWCLARLFVRSATGRKRYNVLGALNAVTHDVVRVCNQGYVTAQTVCTLLRGLAASGLRVPITVVLGNARYQRCELVQSLARQLGIRLLFLPSYSPNLNLIERLWRFVRKQSLNSAWFDSFEQFQAAIDECLNKMATDHKQEAAALFVHKFQRFEDVPILAA